MENLPDHSSEEAESFVAPITGETELPNINREIKDLGRQEHAEERQEIAKSFWENRRIERLNREQKESIQKEFDDLVNNISDSEKNTISRWYSILTGKSEQLKTEKEQLETSLSELEESIQQAPLNEENIKARIEQHYQDLRQEWESLPYERAEIEKYFTTENLSSLSTEDYLTLLRRFPASILTHVTRQGVRDHSGMIEHYLGMGAKHDGMKNILEDGNLRSLIGIHFAKKEDEEAVSSYLQHMLDLTSEIPRNEDENDNSILKDHIDWLCRSDEQSTWSSYGDHTATHFGLNAVMDNYYGAERGNECFAIWPTALLMNEYRIGGNTTNDSQQYDKNNDIWIYTKERDGIALDAGIVFLPEQTKVNPESGSKYELIDGQPVYNQEFADQVITAINNPELPKFIEKLSAIRYEGTIRESYNELKEELNNLGITNEDMVYEIIYNNVHSFDNLPYRIVNYNQAPFYPKAENDARTILNECGLEYKLAEETISAQEYWENYFSENPDLRPKHLVYYSGDPTTAYAHYLQKNGVNYDVKASYRDSTSRNSRYTGELYEIFKDKRGPNDPEFPTRVESFKNLAYKLIDEKFTDKESEPTAQTQ